MIKMRLQKPDYLLEILIVFFDCLNVRSTKEAMFKRKPDLRPYRDPCDPRLSVSVVPDCNFISYSAEHQRELISVPILNLSL